jgi:hypothetical protein
MLELQSKNANYGINVPTEEKEIDEKVLTKLLSNIALPKYYCVIALRYRVKLFDLVITSKSNTKKQQMVSVVPILAKFNEGDLTIGEVGNRVLIDPSEIERGSHLNVNTVITPNKIADYINSDEELTKGVIGRKLGDDSHVYCLEFKIVPCNSIKGIIDGKIEDPFAKNFKSK